MPELAEAPRISMQEKQIDIKQREKFTHVTYIMAQTKSLAERFRKSEGEDASFTLSREAIDHLNQFIPNRQARREGQVGLVLRYNPPSSEGDLKEEKGELHLVDGDKFYILTIRSTSEGGFIIETPENSGFAKPFDLGDEKIVNTLRGIREVLNITLKDQLGKSENMQLPRTPRKSISSRNLTRPPGRNDRARRP